jgi:hypothetical protein
MRSSQFDQFLGARNESRIAHQRRQQNRFRLCPALMPRQDTELQMWVGRNRVIVDSTTVGWPPAHAWAAYLFQRVAILNPNKDFSG